MAKTTTKAKAKAKATRKPRKEWKARFLDRYAKTGNVSQAARLCGIGRRTVYDAREADPAFAEAMDEAEQTALDELERVAWKRAKGYTKSGRYYEPSDRLLIFLLSNKRPDEYAQRSRVELSGPGGKALTVDTEDARKRLAALANDPEAAAAMRIIAEREAELLVAGAIGGEDAANGSGRVNGNGNGRALT